jgi:thioesterase domain-containing protein
VVAFEMARRLAAHDKRVGLLGLIDAAAPRPSTLRPGMLLDRLGALRTFGASAWLDYGRAKVRSLARRSRATRAALEVVVSTGPLKNREQVSRVNLEAIGRYRARDYRDDLVLFRRTEPLPGAAPHDEWLGWRHLAGTMEVERLPSATHESILRQPHVAELARRIRAQIDRRS